MNNDPLNNTDRRALAQDEPDENENTGIAASAGGSGGGGGAQAPPVVVSDEGPGEEQDEEEGPILNFSQTTASPYFSSAGMFAGQSVADVAAQLRAGSSLIGDVPVQFVTIDGNALIINARSALALMQANIPQSSWNLIDQTGNATVESNITQRLIDNGLTSSGTDVLRITGSGSNASTLIP